VRKVQRRSIERIAIQSSSVVERSAVNRLVVGSNPTSGAILFRQHHKSPDWTRRSIAFAFADAVTWLTCGRKNSYRHGKLVGSRFCRAVVSEEDAGGGTARLVRTAFRIGRGKFDILFGAGTANGRALVRSDAG
jgi:hypothetical protein